MESIGRKLKQARKEKNKSLGDIYKQTRVPIEQLQLLEQDQLDFLPEVYVKSFLRSYALTVGLHHETILQEFEEIQRKKAEKAAEERKIKQEELATQSHKLEWTLGLGGFLLLIGMFLLYANYRANMLETSKAGGPAMKDSFQVNLHPQELAINGQVLDEDESKLRLQITAIENVWLKVTTDNVKMEQYTLRPGTSINLLANHRYEILVANAGGVQLHYNNEKISKLGASGVPMRIILTGDGIIERKITNIDRSLQ